MKLPALLPIHLGLVLIGGLSILPQSVLAEGTVSFYGYQINQPRWRSTDFPKSITLSTGGVVTDADGFYGSLGWILPSLESNADLPSFVATDEAIQTDEAQLYRSPSYAKDIDNPATKPDKAVPSLGADDQAILYLTPGVGKEGQLCQIKLTGTIPPSFLVGIAFGNLAHPEEDTYGSASFRVAINDSPGTPQLPAITNDALLDWIFLRVENAVPGDVIRIYGTGGPAGQTNLALIAFDPVAP